MTSRVVLCSKSPWLPSIRREHAFAQLATSHGVTFDLVERPLDVRAVSQVGAVAWGSALVRAQRTCQDGVSVWRRSTVVPGQRGPAWERLENSLLRRSLTSVGTDGAAVVGMLPWQWPALSKVPAARRVFDCADDWSALMPQHATRIRTLCRHIADEADAVLVTSPLLGHLFPGADVRVVRNAVGQDLTSNPPTPAPGRRRMVYVGTLSERFDAALMQAVLAALPDWRLDLYGESKYQGLGDAPGQDLRELMDRFAGRVTWHGLVTRPGLGPVLDSADVLVVPNRPEVAQGQSSMKLYDYSARGRPIVCTELEQDADQVPPHVLLASDATAFADAVAASVFDSEVKVQDRVRWAQANSWASRWLGWSSAVLGAQGAAELGR